MQLPKKSHLSVVTDATAHPKIILADRQLAFACISARTPADRQLAFACINETNSFFGRGFEK